MKFREQPGGPLIDLPLCAMTEQQVIAAASHVGQNSTAVQATRSAVLTCCSAVRRSHRRRATRRELLNVAAEANALPPHLRKYLGWARLATWFIPFPWGTVISAILWTVDQLLAERDDGWIRYSASGAGLVEAQSLGHSKRGCRRPPPYPSVSKAVKEGRLDPQWL